VITFLLHYRLTPLLRRFVIHIFATVILVCFTSPLAAQQMAGSVEAGLQTLAQELLAGLPADQHPALSVLPFPGADQSCPVLSVFMVDELTTTLVSTVRPRPRVVERQQLETIIAQNRLDEFLTDPEQRHRLGGLSGIGAVVLGTFVTIGDRLRINARLVAIDTGETTAAAAVSVPRTGEIAELLRQSSGRGRNCLPEPTVHSAAKASPNTPAATVTRPLPTEESCQEKENVRVCTRNVRSSGQDIQLSLVIENVGNEPVAIAMVGPAPSLTDNDGTTFSLKQMSGLPICGGAFDKALMRAESQSGCLRYNVYLRRSAFRPIPPGGRASTTVQFRADQPSNGTTFTLTAAFGILPEMPSALPAEEAEKLEARPFILMLPNVQESGTQR
jgi:TolB-like protein